MNHRVDVAIPVYKPTKEFRSVLKRLLNQTLPPEKILLVNTEKDLFDETLIAGLDRIEVRHIPKDQFDHGGTRHMAAELLDSELILFMTQDALPKGEHLIEYLADAFDEEQVCAAYARQIPRPDCSELERFARSFNYPQESRVKTAEDLPQLGVKTFFCSNVCAMYRRSAYEEYGGFERHTIFNEDMIFAGKLIYAGKAVAYCAKAEVIHSHDYTAREQFHRNFDLGVSQAEHPEIFSAVPSEEEGTALVRKSAQHLRAIGRPELLFSLFWTSGWKYLGYLLGKNYRRLPKFFVRACSMNKSYWESPP